MEGTLFPRRLSVMLAVSVGFLMAPSWAADQSDLWTALGLPSGGVANRIVMDPSHTQTMYTLVPDRGIYKTTDAGASWTLIYTSKMVVWLEMDPFQSSTLYFTEDNNALFTSTDGGQTWNETDTGLPVNQPANSLAFQDGEPPIFLVADPANTGVLYEVTAEKAVYKSTDGGTHWNESDTGINPASANDLRQGAVSIQSFVIDPANTHVLYLTNTSGADATTGLPGMGLAGVYKSTDGGAHWSQILSGEDIFGLGIQPGNDQVLFASGNYNLYTSTDGGAHWSHTNAPNTPLYSKFCFDPANAQHMWAIGMGLLASADGGATWTEPTTDFLNYDAMDMVVDPNTGTLYSASPGYGVGMSVDGGATWAPANAGIHDVAASQMLVGHDGTVYVGTTASGLFRSADAGAHWTAIDGGLFSGTQTSVKQIVEDPTSGMLYFVNGDFFGSPDQGDNWTRFIVPLSGDYQAIALTPGSPSTVYVGQMQGVQKSTDQGAHWTTINTGLPAPHTDFVGALASSPVDADKAFGGTFNHGLYMTSDGGAHWQHVDGLDMSGVLALAIDPEQANTVYASSDQGGLAKSVDGGMTWSDSGDGMDGDTIALISIDPADGDDLVAMSETAGRIYLSADGGASWTKLDTTSSSTAQAFVSASTSSSGTPVGPSIAALAMDTKHKGMMYAADQSGNMYKVSMAQLVAGLKSASASGSSNGSSGGGELSLTLDLLLLGVLLLRRRN
jgi:photosystem II stability/assembly factor-like uncharacterized protein